MARAAIIVVGGAATRLGGVAKPWLEVLGAPIIDHVVRAARPHVTDIVIVGTPPPDAPALPDVRWTLEDPPGSGPAQAIRAGVTSLADELDEVLLLAGDAPFISLALQRLCALPLVSDGVAARHDDRVQYLLARVDRAALERALAVGGSSLHSVFDHLQIETMEAEVLDADTWEDVARLRTGTGMVEMTGNAWLDEVAGLLGIEATIDVDAVLSLTRDVAHSLERKNAPLTSYLLGFAAAQQSLTPAQVAELAAAIGKRAREHGSDG